MRIKPSLIFIPLSLLAFFSACNKSDSITGPRFAITGTFYARGSGVDVSGIRISDGDQIVYTDKNGHYLMPENQNHETYLLSPSKAGLKFDPPVMRVTVEFDSGWADFIAMNYNGRDGMVVIPAGSFRMGDITRRGDSSEFPVHVVTITHSFLMSRNEVTQGEWWAAGLSIPSVLHGDDLPIESITWYDAVDYCNRLSKSQGLNACYSGSGVDIVCDFSAKGYRLPTEAEWEYACRAGTETDFNTGNMTEVKYYDPALDQAGWYFYNNPYFPTLRQQDVGLKKPNAFGLYDVHGNVDEWCWDWFDRNYYSSGPATDPHGPASGSLRVCRGGSWFDDPPGCRSAKRLAGDPNSRSSDVGFRVVRNY